MRKIIKAAFTYSSVEVLQKGIYFLILPLLTYYISPKEYGNISIVMMVLVIFQMLFTLSLESTVMRFYPRIKNLKLQKIFLGTILYASMVFIFIWVVSLLLIGPFLFEYILPSLQFYPYIFLAILIVAFKVLIMLYISFLKTIQDLKEFSVFYNIYFFLQTGLILLLVTIFEYKKDVLYFIGMLLAQIIMFLWIYLKLIKCTEFTINKRILKFCLDYSISIIPIKISNTINGSIDRYLVFNLLGKGVAGIYFLGWQIASAVQIIMMALNSAYVPKFFESYEKNKYNKSFKQIYNMANFIVLLAIVFEILFLNIYEFVFHIISSKYHEANKIIPFFILYFTINIVYFINTNALSLNSFLNRKKIYGIIIGIFINILVSMYLIKKFGFIGVAIGTIVGQIITVLYFIYLVKKFTSLEFKSFLYLFFIFAIFLVSYMQVNYYLNIFLELGLIMIFYKVVYDPKKHKAT